MQRLRTALEQLDEMISALEDRIGSEIVASREAQKKTAEHLQLSRARETGVLAVSQKVASRLDDAIKHVENILRN